MAFINDNPSWPAVGLLRRRAEATLWADRLDPAFVRSFFAKERPTTTKGKFALARALLLQGDRAGAQSLVREAWRNDEFSDDLEGLALDVFQGLITLADHKARMDMRLYAEDTEGQALEVVRELVIAPGLAHQALCTGAVALQQQRAGERNFPFVVVGRSLAKNERTKAGCDVYHSVASARRRSGRRHGHSDCR